MDQTMKQHIEITDLSSAARRLRRAVITNDCLTKQLPEGSPKQSQRLLYGVKGLIYQKLFENRVGDLIRVNRIAELLKNAATVKRGKAFVIEPDQAIAVWDKIVRVVMTKAVLEVMQPRTPN